MLVLSRKVGEKIVIGDNVTLMICEIRGDKVRVGVSAPKEMKVLRSELLDVQPQQEIPARQVQHSEPILPPT